MNDKKVYIALAADIIHPGHLKIINEGAKYGKVIVGVLTDEAISSYKRLPVFDLNTRVEIVENIRNVSQVITQKSVSYKENLVLIKPDYVIHGDDWRLGAQRKVRQEVIDIIKEWGGELIEVPYTQNLNSEKH